MPSPGFPSDWAEESNMAYLNFTSKLKEIDIEDTSDTTTVEIRDNFANSLWQLKETPFARVKKLADDGDVAMRVELGIRHYVGDGTAEDHNAAQKIWEDVTKDDTLSPSDTPAVKRTLLCLCTLCHEAFQATGALDCLLDAGRFANVVVGLDAQDCAGQVRTATPVTLFTAQQLSRVRERLPAQERAAFDTQTTEMPFLMEVFARRFAALERHDAAREAKVPPNAYECARTGCGVVGTTQTSLRRCAGKCPPEIKPYYCSYECQKLDSKLHKHQYKPRNAASPTTLHVSSPLQQDQQRAPIAKTLPGSLGQSVRITSSTTSAPPTTGMRQLSVAGCARDDDVD